MNLSTQEKLTRGLSIYQDIILDGKVALAGRRDSQARWELIRPYLPPLGAVLDVGSNFGWFGLKFVEEFPECLVASIEADYRSAAVQRHVLQSHMGRRICLLTEPAGGDLLRRMGVGGCLFDAALVLSVLHWIPDHRDFLLRLGEITARIFIEYPHPQESDAGVTQLREEIGRIEEYLREVFPGRPVQRIGQTPNHLHPELPRELWLVSEPEGCCNVPAKALDAATLWSCGLSWPARSWWQGELSRLEKDSADSRNNNQERRLLFTSSGLKWKSEAGETNKKRAYQRGLLALPENQLVTSVQRFQRFGRSALRRMRRYWNRIG